MEIVLAFVIGGLYAAGLYMMMRRNIFKLVLGLGLLGHAANLLLFAMGRLVRGHPPIIPTNAADGPVTVGFVADPLPEALILTAIVIGFGVQAFATVLVRRCYETVGTDDLNNLRSTDQP